MSKTAPITCLITVYNTAEYIAEAVESIVRQTLPIKEIIVVDDGSTDRSGEIAKQAGGDLVRVIRQPNLGTPAGRNRGIDEISQPYVFFMDADDISCLDRIQKSYPEIQRNPECSAVFGNWENFWIAALKDEEQSVSSAYLQGEQSSRILCTGLFRSDFVHKVGHFDPAFGSYTEIQWMTRANQRKEQFHDLGQLVYRRRIHYNNTSRTKSTDSLFDVIVARRKELGNT